MLIAKHKGEKTPAYNTKEPEARDKNWECPLCGEKVIWVKKAADGTISHFRHKNLASHEGISEGKKHEEAKKKLKHVLDEDNNLQSSELEKIIGEYENQYQIADIFLETKDGEKIAVEIQVSDQTVQDFKDRTLFYNDKGLSVIWILDKENYLPEKTTSNTHHKETLLFKESVKWIQKNWYGRCYILTDQLEVKPYRLKNTKVTRTSPEHGQYKKRLKTVAEYSTGDMENYGIFTTDSNQLKIARFYDKCWWSK